MAKRKLEPLVPEIVDLATQNPDMSLAEIGRKTGLDRRRVSEIMRLPQAGRIVRDRMAAGNIGGQLVSGIAKIVTTLDALVDDTLASPDGLTASDVASLLGYLAALTGTLERLARTGVSLDGLADPDDERTLNLIILKAYGRGLGWADGQSPQRVARARTLVHAMIERSMTALDGA